jgi:hypothetical protein
MQQDGQKEKYIQKYDGKHVADQQTGRLRIRNEDDI